MGITSSKLSSNEREVPLDETITNQTLASIDTIDSVEENTDNLSPLQRIRNLSLVNRYKKFPGTEKSLSMNNLEGDLTPKRTSSGLKQRLIKALGGYNLLDPRSPSQFLTRTPLLFGKKEEKVEDKKGIKGKNLMLETSLDGSHISSGQIPERKDDEENPYSLFEEQLDEEQNIKEIDTDRHSTPNTSMASSGSNRSSSKASKSSTLDETDTKDPRSPSENVTRTPMTFAIGILETPTIEIHQIKEVEKSEIVKSTTKSQALIKTMYKEYVQRDPIYRDLLHEDDLEDDCDSGKTTPMKQRPILQEQGKERTPLGCLSNRNKSVLKRGVFPKMSVDDMLDDIYSPKTIGILIDGDENTPGNGSNIVNSNVHSSATNSKSKIPVRSKRIH